MTLPFPKHALFYWLLASVVYFLPGWTLTTEFLFGSKDALFYTMVLKLYGQALAQGEIYPRWFAEANAGQGSPVMIFYSPLAYFITNFLFGWISWFASDAMAQARFILGMIAAQMAAGLTSYLWLKPRFGEKRALFGSLLYILLPYKFYYIWMHHNLAQLWALAWLPLWMLAAEKMMEGNRNGALGYGICLALVAYTHLLTLIAFAALPAFYVLCVSRQPMFRRILPLAAAHAVGLALAAAYFLPMIFNKQFIWSNGFLEDFYSVFRHLNHPDTYLCLYYLAIAMLTAGFISHLPSRPKGERTFWFFAAAAGACWLMTTPLSYPVWKIMPLLEYLQFPMARLHSVLLTGGVWIALYGLEAWCGTSLRLPSWRRWVYSPYAAFLSVAICAAFMGWLGFLSIFCYTSRTYTGEALKEVHRLNGIPPVEYVTIWTNPEAQAAALAVETGKAPASILRGRGELSARWEGNRRLRLEADIASPEAAIGIRQWYFPGWVATGGNVAYKAEVNEKNGHMQFVLPRGNHRLDVALPWLLGEKAGVSISLLMLLAIGIYWPLRKRLR